MRLAEDTPLQIVGTGRGRFTPDTKGISAGELYLVVVVGGTARMRIYR